MIAKGKGDEKDCGGREIGKSSVNSGSSPRSMLERNQGGKNLINIQLEQIKIGVETSQNHEIPEYSDKSWGEGLELSALRVSRQ